MFVASADGDAIGLAGGLRSDEGEGGAELVSMWVAPTWRGTAAAAGLIAGVAEWATEAGFDSLRLWVVEGNARAERAYMKSGFVRTGRVQPVRDGEPQLEIEMERRLMASRR